MSRDETSQQNERQTVRLWPEFAKAIGIGRNVAYKRAGKDFRVVRIGKRILVPRAELERLLIGDSQKSKSAPAKLLNLEGGKGC